MLKGSKHSPKTIAKMVGRKIIVRPEIEAIRRAKISATMKGMKKTPEHIEKVRQAQLGVPRPYATGENSSSWKGNNVSYRTIHQWVQKWLGKPNRCAWCFQEESGRRIQWANLSGEYKRNMTDWVRLCIICHKEFDSRDKPLIMMTKQALATSRFRGSMKNKIII